MEKVRCPNCKNWASWNANPYRPFCSENCKNRDLGKWASEQYRVSEPAIDQEVGIETISTNDSNDESN